MHHAQDQIPNRRSAQASKKGTARGNVRTGDDEAVGVRVDEFVPAGEEAGVVVVGMGAVGGGPGVSLVDHGEEHDGAGPDVKGPRVVMA